VDHLAHPVAVAGTALIDVLDQIAHPRQVRRMLQVGGRDPSPSGKWTVYGIPLGHVSSIGSGCGSLMRSSAENGRRPSSRASMT
jgi:hypothetical protein